MKNVVAIRDNCLRNRCEGMSVHSVQLLLQKQFDRGGRETGMAEMPFLADALVAGHSGSQGILAAV